MSGSYKGNFKRKILVIEDDDINRGILTSILSEDYIVLEASNGRDGLDILNNNEYSVSLILLDIQMPVMNGFEFLNEMMSKKEFNSIPVIVTTSEQNEEEKCLQLGASDFVRKPYSPNIILRRVEALIRLAESSAIIKETEFDSLTGLYARTYFNYLVDKIFLTYPTRNYGLVLFNIEDFSYLNSTFGEEDGNKLLIHVTNAIKHYNTETIIASRYTGAHFALIFKTDKLSINELISTLDNLIYTNSPIKNIHINYAYYLSPSKAISSLSAFARLSDLLNTIQHDYVNMRIEYLDSMLKQENRKHFIQQNMKNSLLNNEFKVFFQPKHDPYTNKLVGAEALVRWIHPKAGFMNPGEFIPVFEENGFITELDLFMLDKTCECLRKMIDEGDKVVPVSINLSRRDLALMENTNEINSILNKYNIDKKLVHFEVTESVAGNNLQNIKKAQMLKDAGYEIEIDDFGSGYSSLGIISDIPMNYLKLDITFARNIQKQKEVIKTIIDLAHALNAKTIAEGVEAEEQLQIYKTLGIDYIQGYYYSKPLNYNEFINYIKKYN